MVLYNKTPVRFFDLPDGKIASFISGNEKNIDIETVKSFGEEWKKFSYFTDAEIESAGKQYFDIVPEKILNKDALVLDIGAGSGRWTKYIAGKVKFVEAIDPGHSVFSAQHFLKVNSNVRITQAAVSNIPFNDRSFDFVFSLGVFHHLPNTQEAITESVKKIKTGGHFLLYLYYSLDNRGPVYKLLFYVSNLFRLIISNMPSAIKKLICDCIAIIVYVPLVALAKFARLFTKSWKKMPLSYYADKSFRMMRNDALDRFGTPLEKRFSRKKIKAMMEEAGLSEIIFSEHEPFWHAIGKRV